MRYAVLTSGSCGNAYAFSDGGRTILVDMGLTLSGLKRRLEDVGIPFEGISDVYVTHSHPDHSKGLGVLHRATGAAIHVSRKSFEVDRSVYARLGLDGDRLSLFDFGEDLASGRFVVHPFATSHDAAGSAGYFITNGASRFFLMTDTGLYSDEAVELARRADVLFVESNYDELMLEEGRYPLFLKARIRGGRGHLSNSQSFRFLEESGSLGKPVFLVHLSDNNNTVQRVQQLYAGRPSVVACDRGRTYGAYDV